MDKKMRQDYQNDKEKYQSFLKAINCCPLCSSPLILIHEFYTGGHRVQETAHCDQCEIQTRRKDHTCH